MLGPEVWQFAAPTVWSQTIHKHDTTFNNESKVWDKIKSVHFNHLVSVIIPTDINTTTYELANDLKVDCDYYKVANVNCSEFVEEQFLKTFIQRGELIVLSVATRIDTDDCFCITSTGHLILSLNKASYQSLGIDGRVSAYHKASKSKYFVEINLHQLNVKQKPYKRLLDRLKTLNFNVILTWTPPCAMDQQSTTICPSTIAKYFHDKQYSVTLNEPVYECQTHRNVTVPSFPSDKDDVAEYMEWCGMMVIGGDVNDNGFDSYVSTYTPPDTVGDAKQQQPQIAVLMWRGLFTARKIRSMIEKIRVSRIGKYPWASIHVQGFSDSPVNFGRNEHHYYTSGDYGYFIALMEDNYSFTEFRVSNKRYKRIKSNNSKFK